MRYDAEQKDRTRAKVLAEAVKTIHSGGAEQLGVVDVMKRAGLTHGGFYAHFSSRDDLLLAAVAEMFQVAEANFAAIVAGLAPAAALTAYVDWYLSRDHSQASTWGCPLPRLSGDVSRLPVAARARYTDGVNRLTRAVASRLRALGRDEATAVASSAVAEMIGALLVSRAVADPAHAERILERSRASVLARLGVGEAA